MTICDDLYAFIYGKFQDSHNAITDNYDVWDREEFRIEHERLRFFMTISAWIHKNKTNLEKTFDSKQVILDAIIEFMDAQWQDSNRSKVGWWGSQSALADIKEFINSYPEKAEIPKKPKLTLAYSADKVGA